MAFLQANLKQRLQAKQSKTVMIKNIISFTIIFISQVFICSCTANEIDDISEDLNSVQLDTGKGGFKFSCTDEFEGYTIPVYYYIPSNCDLQSAPIQFVMHGTNRNAGDYRDSWITEAEEYKCIVLAPMFDKNQFPESYYQTGNVVAKPSGEVNPKEKYTYNIIEQIFLYFREAICSERNQFNIYGHSAGAQFVQRYMLFMDTKNVNKAVVANPGYYTYPDNDIMYPYGIKNIDKVNVRDYLSKDITFMLGAADTIRDANLRVTPEADAQGLNRYSRGCNFYDYCYNLSEQLGCNFSWSKYEVEKVGHSNTVMAPVAADIIYADESSSHLIGTRRMEMGKRIYHINGALSAIQNGITIELHENGDIKKIYFKE